MRALLDLMRANEASVQKQAARFAILLEFLRRQLPILDPEAGAGELIQAVAAAIANLRMP